MNKGYLLLMLLLPVIAAAFRIVAFAMLDGKMRTSLWSCAVDQLKAIGLFALLGPPFGGLAFGTISAVLSGEWYGFLIVIPFILMSHAFGALPAIATAAVVAALKPWLWGWRTLAASGVAGAVQTILWLAACSLAEMWVAVAAAAGIGAFAGAVCALILYGAPGKARR